MLVTEENGTIELLPALPERFAQSGAVRDMVVNGVKISFEWENGVVVCIHADQPVCVSSKHISNHVIRDNQVTIVPLLSE